MEIIDLLLFILPAYVANATPVIFNGRTPIDLGKELQDKQRIFGENKTIIGFLFGVTSGTITGIAIITIFPQLFMQLSLNEKILTAFLLSLGAMLGDLIGSFVKRRRKMKSGQESTIMDKILFVIIALIVAYPVYNTKVNLVFTDILLVVVATFFLHILFNRIAHATKLKKVPW